MLIKDSRLGAKWKPFSLRYCTTRFRGQYILSTTQHKSCEMAELELNLNSQVQHLKGCPVKEWFNKIHNQIHIHSHWADRIIRHPVTETLDIRNELGDFSETYLSTHYWLDTSIQCILATESSSTRTQASWKQGLSVCSFICSFTHSHRQLTVLSYTLNTEDIGVNRTSKYILCLGGDMCCQEKRKH